MWVMKMLGIDMQQPIEYENASLRFFEKNEHHISRLCTSDVLLLVFEGVLRFSEDGIEYEVCPGEYHIQKSNTVQRGEIASDAPKYLWVHFHGHWTAAENAFSPRGTFDYSALKPSIERMDALAHSSASYIEKTAVFYNLLCALYQKEPSVTLARQIAAFIHTEYRNNFSLDDICRQFNFSKNHVINVFKEEYGQTPFQYLNTVRIRQAEYLLEVTSDSIECIAYASGYQHYSHFYRQFRKKNHCSPEQWRYKKRLQLSAHRT